MDLKDKVVILTGANRIGQDVARTLLAAGAKLAISYFNHKPDLNLTGEILYVQADLSNADQAVSTVAQTVHRFGRVDALVHMAAIYKRTPWTSVNEADWNENMNTIAKSAFLMSRAFSQRAEAGKIVLISDWSVQSQPYRDYLPYNAAKAAVEGLTKSLAKELAPKFTVNCVAPGPMLQPPDLSEAENREVLKNTPLGKWGGEHEVTRAIMYFLESDFTTGQILAVDGGRSIA